jgi:hypothetical protein|tara:strand:- start:123 stop:326 length:204 start_codon:yes stop_codon:yes gene_type:complete
MPQVGSNENPMMFRKAIVSKDSRFRKGMNLSQYKDNYDRIFKKDSTEYSTEFEAARAKSKTFSMEQD